jgi:three-Cys-motif partner protein
MLSVKSMPQASDFFVEPNPRSLDKLGLLGGYLKPLCYKLGSTCGPRRPWKHVWIIDGFAGQGAYAPDAGGRIQDGSPLIAAKWARQLQLERRYPIVRCVNVETDPGNFTRLERNLAPWRDVAIALRGEFADHIDDIMDMVGTDPALVFLDPFGLKGIEMETIEKLLDRGANTKTELLIHFSDRTFKRMAGNMSDNASRQPVGVKSATSKIMQLDRVVGTPMWRRIWNSPEYDNQKAMDRIAELYLSELRRRIGFANQILMRDNYGDTPAYRLVFCTGSAHGVEQVSHLAHRYEKEIKDRARPGQTDLFSDQEERQQLTALRDHIQTVGIQHKLITPKQIRHVLVPELFGLYSSTDYAKAIRELVSSEIVARDNAVGIKDNERLRFIESAQGSLLGA